MKQTPPIYRVTLLVLLTITILSLESTTTIEASPVVTTPAIEKNIVIERIPILSIREEQRMTQIQIKQQAIKVVKSEKEEKAPVELSEEDIINEYVEEICAMYGITPEIVKSMIFYESTYNPKATNGNCKGLMQVSERWHKDRMKRLGVTDIYDPYGNILVGVDFLSELIDKYEDLELVLMLYNMKRSTAFRMFEEGDISDYAIKIIERAQAMEEGEW